MERLEACPHWNLSPMHLEGSSPLQKSAPPCASGLVTDQKNKVSLLRQEATQMVKNAACREHPAGGNDDPRTGKLVERFGLLDGSMEFHVAGKKAASSILAKVFIRGLYI